MVTHSVEQLEKNVEISFGYVKKDLLSLNDSISELHDKIQHLSMNNAMLLDKLMGIEKKISPSEKPKDEKEELEFYDVKEKKKFKSKIYTIKIINNRRFAVSDSPSGSKSYRILGSAKKTPVKKITKKAKISTKKVAIKNDSKKKSTAKPKKIIRETTVF